MKESTERTIRLGLSRNPKKVFDEIDRVVAEMIRLGWKLKDQYVEESLENIHLFFEREIKIEKKG